MNEFIRRDILLNFDQIEKIESAKIALFGLGGVGGYAFEALLRMGVKHFILCDGDSFQESNLNRQILSNKESLHKNKAQVAKMRAESIFENLDIEVFPEFINIDTITKIDLSGCFIVDAIDDVKNKVLLAKYAEENNLPIVSMMGAGNRLSASFIESDIYKTVNDPLSKKMRYELKKSGVQKLKVVYTKDNPVDTESKEIGSISYVVGMAGLKLAEVVINEIINN